MRLLGSLWLIDAKVNHDQSNILVTIRGNRTIKTISAIQMEGPRPKLQELLVCCNFVEGLAYEEEECWLAIEQNVLAIGRVTLPKIEEDQGPENGANLPYLDRFYTFTEKDIEVKETSARVKVKNLKIITWTLFKSKQFRILNLKTNRDSEFFRINAHINEELAVQAESLFQDYEDVFA